MASTSASKVAGLVMDEFTSGSQERETFSSAHEVAGTTTGIWRSVDRP